MKTVIMGAFLLMITLVGCTTPQIPDNPPVNPPTGVPVNLQPGTYGSSGMLPDEITGTTFKSVDEFKSFVKANRATSGYNMYYRGGMAVDMMESSMVKTASAPMAASDASGGNTFSETNNQVAGVDEADTTKTDGSYIYTITNNIVYIVKAYPGDSAEVVGKIRFEDATPEGLFVKDGKLAVFGSYHNYDWFSKENVRPMSGMTFFNIYDIADKANPKLSDDYKFEGSYFNARMKDNHIYFVARSMPEVRPLPMPYIMEGDALRTMPVDSIYYYNIPYNNPQFVTVHGIDVSSGNLVDSKTVAVDNTESLYMSEDNIFITYTEWINEYDIRMKIMMDMLESKLSDSDKQLIAKVKATDDDVLSKYEKDQKIYQVYSTYVSYLSTEEQEDLEDDLSEAVKKKMEEYEHLQFTVVNKIGVEKGKVTVLANGKVPGRIINQFSMDENNGNLRIATTIDQTWSYYGQENEESTNNVYVLDKDMETIGELEGLAETEQIYSTRFIGDRLYMVTFRQVDPFFVIDLSNPKSPKELGKLKIPGFSRYMHPYDDNTIIGIGQDATESGRVKGLKISLFDVSDVSKPKELAKFVTEERYAQSNALYEHKAFLFDREKQLLVIPVYSYDYDYRSGSTGYNGAFVFDIERDSIELRGLIDHSKGSTGHYNALVERSLWINELLYTKSPTLLRINKIDDLSSVKNVDLDSAPTGIKVY